MVSRGQAGFMLLEVMVAFVIAAIALAALYAGATQGLRGGTSAMRARQALALARNHLALLGFAGDAEEGDEDGFHWRLQMQPRAIAETAVDGSGRTMRVALYDIAVQVSWRGGHAVRLGTRRIGLLPAVAP